MLSELAQIILELLESKKINALIQKYPDLQVAVDAGINNIQYLNWIVKRGGDEPIEDIIGVITTFDKNKRRLKDKGYSSDIYAYKSVGEIRQAFEQMDPTSVDDEVKASQTDILGKFGDWTVVMPHTRESSCAWGTGTTWCTAATKTQNMFLNYVGRKNQNVVLYYLIQSGQSTRINPNSKLSVGFVDGQPVLDGKNGGISVNVSNRGLTEQDLQQILGQQYEPIMQSMTDHAGGIKGVHPAKKEMERAAQDVQYLKSLTKKMKPDTLLDFYERILEYDPATEVLMLLAQSGNRQLQKKIVRLPPDPPWAIPKPRELSPEVLKVLARSKDRLIQKIVAKNPSTPPETLKDLAQERNAGVVNRVAMNPSTPLETLNQLVRSNNWDIKKYVAKNPSAPPEVLKDLVRSNNWDIIFAVLQNPSTPPETLKDLAKDEDWWSLIVKHPNTPPEALKGLAQNGDLDWYLQEEIAAHPNTPIDVIKWWAQIYDRPRLQQIAQKNLDNRLEQMTEVKKRFQQLAGLIK
jgi:hypothetical protein